MTASTCPYFLFSFWRVKKNSLYLNSNTRTGINQSQRQQRMGDPCTWVLYKGKEITKMLYLPQCLSQGFFLTDSHVLAEIFILFSSNSLISNSSDSCRNRAQENFGKVAVKMEASQLRKIPGIKTPLHSANSKTQMHTRQERKTDTNIHMQRSRASIFLPCFCLQHLCRESSWTGAHQNHSIRPALPTRV